MGYCYMHNIHDCGVPCPFTTYTHAHTYTIQGVPLWTKLEKLLKNKNFSPESTQLSEMPEVRSDIDKAIITTLPEINEDDDEM